MNGVKCLAVCGRRVGGWSAARAVMLLDKSGSADCFLS